MNEAANEWDAHADRWDTDPTTRAYAEAAFESLSAASSGLSFAASMKKA